MRDIFKGYLLVSDMDGTLLNSKGELSEENRLAIDYFVDNGGTFTLATGRMLASAEKFIPNLKVGLPVILYNGSKIYDYSKETILHENYLEEKRKEIVKKVREIAPHLGIEVFSEERDYVINRCKYTDRLATSICETIYDIPNELWTQKWIKILMIGEEDELDELERNFSSICDEAAVIRSGEKFLEIVPNYTSKGRALQRLVKDFNIDPNKVIAVGDNMNDSELIKTAKYGFCIGSGSKRLLDEAEYVAPTNDENAIAYIVNWLEEKIKKGEI
ncbi:Cof-type HAD-IIB family hydrolase [Clostridium carnis]